MLVNAQPNNTNTEGRGIFTALSDEYILLWTIEFISKTRTKALGKEWANTYSKNNKLGKAVLPDSTEAVALLLWQTVLHCPFEGWVEESLLVGKDLSGRCLPPDGSIEGIPQKSIKFKNSLLKQGIIWEYWS